MNDIIKNDSLNLIYKPKMLTSFDIVRIVRNITGIKKVGHAGTLDPNAEGLMIVGVGNGTKLLTNATGLDKTYVAEIELGSETTTGDCDGQVIQSCETPPFDEGHIKKTIEDFIGEHELAVSIYSAIKKNGRPLYSYAHKGQKVERPIRTMRVYSSRFISYNHPVITAEFSVSSGTYIRSIAEAIGRKLNSFAHLKNLKRTTIGHFQSKDAIHLPKNIIDEFVSYRSNKKTPR